MYLKNGSAGSEVAAVQAALNRLAPAGTTKLATDGLFGPLTEGRVRQHQQVNRVHSDGVVGPITLDTLFDIVTMTGKLRVRHNPGLTSSAIAPPRLVPPLTPPLGPMADWLNPALAEAARQQAAFWEWWHRPQPKPPLPTPTPSGPSGSWTPLFIPEPRIDIPGPPLKQTQIQLTKETEGSGFTVGLSGESAFDVAKWKFKEAKYQLTVDYAVFKGRWAELEIGTSLAQNHKGDISAEAEVTLTGGSGLTLKTKLGQIGVAKMVPYLATAVSTELAIEASAGVKGAIELNITKIGGRHQLKAVFTGKAGPKVTFGPDKLPDGREVHRLSGTPFGATGILGLELEFD